MAHATKPSGDVLNGTRVDVEVKAPTAVDVGGTCTDAARMPCRVDVSGNRGGVMLMVLSPDAGLYHCMIMTTSVNLRK